MDFIEVYKKIEKQNKLFFNKRSLELQDFINLFKQSPQKATAIWALELASTTLDMFQDLTGNTDETPVKTIELAWKWTLGEVKKRDVRPWVMKTLKLAKQLNADKDTKDQAYFLTAIAYAVLSVDSKRYGLKYVFYDLTGVVYLFNRNDFADGVKTRIEHYYDKLVEINEASSEFGDRLASHLRKKV